MGGLRTWKCRQCGRANSTEIGLDGIGTCEHCTKTTAVQPSRIRNGVILPASFPSRPKAKEGAAAAPSEDSSDDRNRGPQPRPRT